jgi:uncharacterized protein YbjT (DUF2867 family)
MTKVLILGANGQLARNTTRVFQKDAEAHLTLYLRRASRLTNPDPKRVTIVEGDVLDAATLQKAMRGEDVVYANLASDKRDCRRDACGRREAADLHQLDGHLSGSAR